jgi:hypothetical protein
LPPPGKDGKSPKMNPTQKQFPIGLKLMKTTQNMKSKFIFIAMAFVVALFTGCGTERSFGPRMELNQSNYTLIKGGAIGKSYGFRLFGFIPIVSPTVATAKQRLYKSVNEDLSGRTVTLANQVENLSVTYLILFSIPKETLTADVIELKGNSPSPRSIPK